MAKTYNNLVDTLLSGRTKFQPDDLLTSTPNPIEGQPKPDDSDESDTTQYKGVDLSHPDIQDALNELGPADKITPFSKDEQSQQVQPSNEIEDPMITAIRNKYVTSQNPNSENQPEQAPAPQQKSLLDSVMPQRKPESDYIKALRSRDDRLNKLLLEDSLTRAADQFQYGKMGKSNRLDILKSMVNNPVTDVTGELDYNKQKVAADELTSMADPNSDISKFYREQAYSALKKANPDSKLEGKLDNMSADQLQKALGKSVFSNMNLTPYQQQMLDVYKQRIELAKNSQETREKTLGFNMDKQEANMAEKLNKSMDAMTASGRNELGRMTRVAGAARQLDLMLQTKKANEFDKRDIQELAIITNSLLTGGGTTAHSAIEQLVPRTYKGDIMGFIEKLSNTPQSVEAQDFVKQFKKIAEREKTYSDAGIRKILGSNTDAFYKLKEKNPEAFDNIVNSKLNVNSDLNQIVNDLGAKKAQSAVAAPKAPQKDTQKVPVKKEFNSKLNKTRVTYDDGSVEVLDGRQ